MGTVMSPLRSGFFAAVEPETIQKTGSSINNKNEMIAVLQLNLSVIHAHPLRRSASFIIDLLFASRLLRYDNKTVIKSCLLK
jgi:hypothetical protein